MRGVNFQRRNQRETKREGVVSCALRAGGLSSEWGLGRRAYQASSSIEICWGHLPQHPNVAFFTVSMPWPLWISALTKSAGYDCNKESKPYDPMLPPDSVFPALPTTYGSLLCISSISEKVGARGDRRAKNSHFSVEETEAQRHKVSPQLVNVNQMYWLFIVPPAHTCHPEDTQCHKLWKWLFIMWLLDHYNSTGTVSQGYCSNLCPGWR